VISGRYVAEKTSLILQRRIKILVAIDLKTNRANNDRVMTAGNSKNGLLSPRNIEALLTM
jgi:hypothetical protein